MAKKLVLSNGETIWYDATNSNAIKTMNSYIKKLESELELALKRKEGIKSSGVVDKYSDMQAAQLRGLVIKRGGNPDEVVEGLHSRQRAIVLREWLRSHTKGKIIDKGGKKRLTNKEVKEIASPHKKLKVSAKTEKLAKNLRGSQKPTKRRM